jgi:hypothetical protein
MKIITLSILAMLLGCQNEPESIENCGCETNSATEILNDKIGQVDRYSDYYDIIANDKRYVLCNKLPDEFKNDELQVKFSGLIKLPCPNAKYRGILLELTKITIN